MTGELQSGRTDCVAATYQAQIRVSPRTDLTDEQVNAICDQIRAVGFAIHNFFGPGFREKVYERALTHRLRKAGLKVDTQVDVRICDEDGTELITEVLDLIVEAVVVVELKAVTDPSTADTAQILGYLKASCFRHGLLINFGGPTFRIRKFVV